MKTIQNNGLVPYIIIKLLHQQISIVCISHLPSVSKVEGETIELLNKELTPGEKLAERSALLFGVVGVFIFVSKDEMKTGENLLEEVYYLHCSLTLSNNWCR